MTFQEFLALSISCALFCMYLSYKKRKETSTQTAHEHHFHKFEDGEEGCINWKLKEIYLNYDFELEGKISGVRIYQENGLLMSRWVDPYTLDNRPDLANEQQRKYWEEVFPELSLVKTQ